MYLVCEPLFIGLVWVLVLLTVFFISKYKNAILSLSLTGINRYSNVI